MPGQKKDTKHLKWIRITMDLRWEFRVKLGTGGTLFQPDTWSGYENIWPYNLNF